MLYFVSGEAAYSYITHFRSRGRIMAVQTAWGIDIGEASIKAIKLAKIREFAEIIDVDVIPLQSGSAQEGEENIDKEVHLATALQEFSRRHDPTGSAIVASLPGKITLSKPATLPPVEESKLADLVRLEVQQQIPFPIDEIVWDYFRCNDEIVPGQEVEVNLVAIRKEIVEEYLERFEQAAIPISALQSAPIALFNLAKHETTPQGNSVIIDVGAENTYLIIIDRDRFWLRTLNIAGRNITTALSEKFEIPFDEAEMLKINSSTSKHSTKIFSVVKPVLHELVGEIHRTIGFYKSMSKDVSFDRVVFMGNTTKLAGFEKFFGENLPYKIHTMEGLANVRVSRAINIKALKHHLPGLGVSMGLALQGLGMSRCKVNLVPEEMRAETSSSNMGMMIGSMCTLLLTIVLGFVSAGMALSASKEKAELLGDTNVPPGIEQVMKWQEELATTESKIRSTEKELKKMLADHSNAKIMPNLILSEINKALVDKDKCKIKELGTQDGYDRFQELNGTDIKLRHILVNYQPAEEIKTTVIVRGKKKTKPKKIPAYYQVFIVGIVEFKNNSDIETEEYIADNFIKKLAKSSLTFTEMESPCTTSDSSNFRTNNFLEADYNFANLEKPTINEKSDEGKFYAFLVEWKVNPNPTIETTSTEEQK